jgi:uncharacterized radical SAM superfamily Fe-S cluster-containing enzyme
MSLGMPLRDERVMRYVTAFCPECHRESPDQDLSRVRRLAGYLAERDGKAWLVRGCPEHGRITTLYDERADILHWLEQWTAPTKAHMPDTPGNFDPVPVAYARGLGEMQTQHTCILLEDITAACNLTCPTCFAESSPGQHHGFVPVRDVLANVDQRLARENGRLDVVMLSGGEPTIHPEFIGVLEGLLEREVQRILINTNGIRIATDDRLLAFLEKHNTLEFNPKKGEDILVRKGWKRDGAGFWEDPQGSHLTLDIIGFGASGPATGPVTGPSASWALLGDLAWESSLLFVLYGLWQFAGSFTDPNVVATVDLDAWIEGQPPPGPPPDSF